jgi:hypothetical protein
MDSLAQNLTTTLDQLLQKKLEFYIDNRLYKKGHLILYRMKHLDNYFYIDLVIEKESKKLETLKINYPFVLEFYADDGLYLDYRISAFTKNKEVQEQIKELKQKITSDNRLFNKILYIKIV